MPIQTINPTTNKVIESFTEMTDEQVDKAVTKASKTYESWKQTDFKKRVDILRSNSDSIPFFQQLILHQQLTLLKIQTEKTKYLPTINLNGFLGANQFTSTFNPAQANSWFGHSNISLVVKLPILIGEDRNRSSGALSHLLSKK